MELRALWNTGRPTFGVWSVLSAPLVVEVLGCAGFDWVGIDAQHGLVGRDGTVDLLRAIGWTGTPAFVRVSSHDPGEIGKALDAGAQGAIIPMVNNADEAQRAVRACRYAPEGDRSWGPTRLSLRHPGHNPADANRDVLCVVMIETVEGAEHVEEIAAVPGVDAVFIGPTDLAVSAGLPPSLGFEHPEHDRLAQRVLDACNHQGVVAGIYCNSVSVAERRLEQGFRMLAVVTDMTLLNTAAKDAARRFSRPD
jgi:4-hydroxy-2-oxoheptanedioate aldolase